MRCPWEAMQEGQVGSTVQGRDKEPPQLFSTANGTELFSCLFTGQVGMKHLLCSGARDSVGKADTKQSVRSCTKSLPCPPLFTASYTHQELLECSSSASPRGQAQCQPLYCSVASRWGIRKGITVSTSVLRYKDPGRTLIKAMHNSLGDTFWSEREAKGRMQEKWQSTCSTLLLSVVIYWIKAQRTFYSFYLYICSTFP